jgi:GT2 family glycosyltransferase
MKWKDPRFRTMPAIPPPKTSIVIVNWERPQDTVECLRSIYAADCPDTTVLLVDNGSKDGSPEKITAVFPELAVFQLPENLGFAKGYNEGIRLALQSGAQNILLLNNDTVVEKEALAALEAAPWDVSVPKILYYHKPDRIWSAGCRWRAFPPSVIMRGYNQKDGPAYSQPTPLEYATSCALFIKRPVLESVGGFDPVFSSYMEDYDFSYKIRAAGFSIGYTPEARILHKVSQSLGADSPQRWRLQGRNTVLFYRKDGRFPARYLLTFLAWFTTREFIKGRAAILPAFWRGVQEGLAELRPES